MSSYNKTVYIILDAFRHDYLSEESTPFLFKLSQDSLYFKKLVPSYGFCERTELLVGLTSIESNYFTAIGFDPDNSPYKGVSFILTLIEPILKYMPRLVVKIFKRLLWEFISLKKHGFAPLNIPLSQLKYFSLTEDGKNSAIKNNKNSLYRIIEKLGARINDTSFTALNQRQGGDDNDRINKLVENINDDSLVYLLYISDCDKYGHIYGPHASEFKLELTKVDKNISQLYSEINSKNRNVNWVIVGDHGMTEVACKLDVMDAVKQALEKYDYGSDFIVFADSTVFRVWVLNESKKVEISVELENLFASNLLRENGTFTNPSSLGFKDDRKYGDFIWLANNGVLISPDNFNASEKKIKGMHGYNPKDNLSSYGMAICSGPDFTDKKIEKECLTSVYLELCRVYGAGTKS